MGIGSADGKGSEGKDDCDEAREQGKKKTYIGFFQDKAVPESVVERGSLCDSLAELYARLCLKARL